MSIPSSRLGGNIAVGSNALIGRLAERHRLAVWLRDPSGPATMVLSGPGGSGRSSLARWVASQAELGTVVSAVVATPQLSARGLIDHWIEAATEHSAPDLGQLKSGQLARVAVSALKSLGLRRQVVCVVDDADRLSAVTAGLLIDVISSMDTSGVRPPAVKFLLVVDEVVAPDASVHASLGEVVGDRVHLAGMDLTDLGELLRQAGFYFTRTQITELARLTDSLPVVALQTAARRVVPERVGHLVGLQPRPDQPDDLIAVASVLDGWWSAAQLAVASGAALDEVRWFTQRSAGAGLMQVEHGRTRFAHPSRRIDALERMSSTQRRQVQSNAAARIARDAESGTDRITAGLLVVRAGGAREQALDVVRGVESALEVGDWPAANVLGEALAQVLGGPTLPLVPSTAALWWWLAGRAAYMDNDARRAIPLLEQAIASATAAGEDCRPLRLAAAHELVRVHLGERPLRGRQDAVTSELEAVLVGDPLDTAEAINAVATLAQAFFVAGDPMEALSCIARVQAGAQISPGHADARSRLANVEGLCHLAILELPQAEMAFSRACALASRGASNHTTLIVGIRRCMAHILAGEVTLALLGLEELSADAEAAELLGEAGFAAALLFVAQVISGSPGARDALARAARLHRRTGHSHTATMFAPTALALDSRTDGSNNLAGLGVEVDSYVRPSAIRALAAVERRDRPALLAAVESASWGHGVLGPVTFDRMVIVAACAEAGAMLDRRDLAESAISPLEAFHRNGFKLMLGWPASISRLNATAARVLGRLDDARRLLADANRVCEREGLLAELAKVRLEQALVALADGRPNDVSESLLLEASARFDALGMSAWVHECHRIAGEHRLRSHSGLRSIQQERCIMTTDIVGSTELNARLGDAEYFMILEQHDRIVTTRIAEFGGHLIKHTGDGLNASFSRAVDAVECGRAMQGDLRQWSVMEPLHAPAVRCGIGIGLVTPAGDEFHGIVQSQVARLCALAAPGEVLVSLAVVQAVGDLVSLESIGEHELRGFPTLVEIYRVVLATQPG